ncbi:MAG: iron complex outermembrane receptor protein [Cyclobacteriaceae bacterium]|jgi:iron complex outermembrane receptor protein
MNNTITKIIAGAALMVLMVGAAFAQTKISGKITDTENGEELIGVNILVKGTVLGTITDVDGQFSLSVNSAPPLTLIITSIGYERQEIGVTSAIVTGLDVQMTESFMLGQEVVVSASRVEESILQSPVSIEKMDILAVQNTSADTYYKAIANLKGVDVASSSINFQIINARGFGSTGNTRFVQLIDGMDTQAPALNFPIGNLNGPSELDVESVELIPGASSALYGPSAFNGVLLINSKNPFEYQGLSAFAKTGVNHIGDNADQGVAPMFEASIRYAKAFNDKFAFKINASYSRADDWHGNDALDRNAESNPLAAIGGVNPGADRLHFHGDEAGINLAIFPFSSAFGVIANNANFGGGRFASQYMNAGDLPNHVVNLTPYKEVDLINYGAENKKLNVGLFYRLTDNIEASYLYNGGFGTSIYTGAQRYSLTNFGIQQHRLQLRGDNFNLKAYATFENSGDSYITEFLAKRMNDLVTGFRFGDYTVERSGNPNAGAFNPFYTAANEANGTPSNGSLTGYLVDYGVEYLRSLNTQGLQPGDISNLSESERLIAQQQAHSFARGVVDSRYILTKDGTVTDPGTGETYTFEQLKQRALQGVVPNGPKFADRSAMYHAEGQFDFKNQIDWMELQVGSSFRIFDLGSEGTIFPDTIGNEISIREFGIYAQAAKRVSDNLKFSGSLRFDKNQNFEGQFNPRLSAVYTVNKNHNFRLSLQTGFRFPTTQGQYIDLDVISERLVGGLPEFYEAYLPDPDNNFYYNGSSVDQFRARLFQGETTEEAATSLVRRMEGSFNPVKAERVKSIEVGYKSLIQNKLLIDGSYYYNIYTDFISQEQIVASLKDGEGNPAYTSLLNPDSKIPSQLASNETDAATAFFIYTNLNSTVRTQGAAVGITYSLSGGYTLGGNYSWNKFIDGYDENVLNDFNTPEHKFNLNFGNRKVTDNFGFNITYRWQDAFRWESSFAEGDVAAYSTLDAQVSYRLKDLQSVVKLGGSNLLGDYYLQSLGGPNIGAIYYISVTFDQLMN